MPDLANQEVGTERPQTLGMHSQNMATGNNIQPTFIGIGGHKCASTWLSECMREHPEIFMSEPKELAYFSNQYEKGTDWYLEHYRRSEGYPQIGEFTSHYIYDPEVPARILETVGPVKVLAVIREPVSRAMSQIKYGIRHGYLERPKNKVISLPELEQHIERYPAIVERSYYAAGIRRFNELFGAENVLILDQRDCNGNPQPVLKKVWSFLEVDTEFDPQATERQISKGITPKLMFLEKMRHRMFYFANARLPHLITLSRKYGIGDFYRKLNSGKTLELAPESSTWLAELFAEDWRESCALCWRPEAEGDGEQT